jgi:hypothetical protein
MPPTRREQIDSDTLQDWLKPAATTPERTKALIAAGVPSWAIAAATGSSTGTVRNWQLGETEPRPQAALLLDYLRASMSILIQGGFPPNRAALILQSVEENPPYERPIEIIGERPERVIDMAKEQVARQAERDV